jgi:hypothetical protein
MMQFITSRLSSLRIPTPNVSYCVQKAVLWPPNSSNLTGKVFKYGTMVVLSNILLQRQFSISRSSLKNKESQNEGKNDIK